MKIVPEVYGKWQTVYKRFIRWRKGNLDEIVYKYCVLGRFTRSNDRQCCSESECLCNRGYGKEEEGLGRSKVGFTSKINALIYAWEIH